MPIDTSIYANLLRPPKSVAEYDAEAAQTQSNKLALAMNQAKMAEMQRGIEHENALAQAYRNSVGADGSVDRNKLYTAAAQAGLGAKIPAIQKGYAEVDKLTADAAESKAKTGKIDLEAVGIASQQHKDMLGAVNDPQSAAKWVAAAYSDPRLAAISSHGGTLEEAIARIPTDPAKFQEWKMQSSLGADKLIEYTRANANTVANNQTQVATNAATNATSRANNAATVGASYANAAATRAIAQATRDAASIQRDQTIEMKLGDDYRAQSKNFKEVSDAYRQINSTLDKATTSPAATLAAATKFMKLLDPGSVVRESELGMALAATGVFDRATNYFNTLQSGKVLTPNQVADFKNITGQIYKAAQTGQQQIDASYTKQAQTYKLRPEMIVQDFGQNAKPGASIPKGWSVKEH